MFGQFGVLSALEGGQRGNEGSVAVGEGAQDGAGHVAVQQISVVRAGLGLFHGHPGSIVGRQPQIGLPQGALALFIAVQIIRLRQGSQDQRLPLIRGDRRGVEADQGEAGQGEPYDLRSLLAALLLALLLIEFGMYAYENL